MFLDFGCILKAKKTIMIQFRCQVKNPEKEQRLIEFSPTLCTTLEKIFVSFQLLKIFKHSIVKSLVLLQISPIVIG